MTAGVAAGVTVQEATSRKVVLQQIVREEWLHVPGMVKGRVGLQIKCKRPDGECFILGECVSLTVWCLYEVI